MSGHVCVLYIGVEYERSCICVLGVCHVYVWGRV